jgi:hypothetical protein
LGLKKCPSTSPLTLPLKKRAPLRNRGSITSCAAASGI